MSTITNGRAATPNDVPVRSRYRLIILLGLVLSLFPTAFSFTQALDSRKSGSYVLVKKTQGAFTLSASGKSAALCVSSEDFPAVIRVAKDLQADMRRVTNVQATLTVDSLPVSKEVVIIGTVGKSPLIAALARQGKIDIKGIEGKWETYIIQVVEKPFPHVDRALVIAGSDKRGTVFGVYDLSGKIGVSPWYWWADVPVRHQSNLFVRPGRYTLGEPAVKYRGVFINDEAPALSGWTKEKFGGVNHVFYEKVFELILRMKGNFLWPAMWGESFYDDDSLSPKLADEYGVVIGTSHHEPMMRAHDEWRRYGKGAWNYEKNDTLLRDFWQKGIKRMNSYESLVTVGMRGDGDEPMSEKADIALLERIVKDQRQILGDVTGKDVSTIPQVWALYKEVQEYYDKGMRVPDDVTLLLCDDNWGNIRKLPKLMDPPRKGGYGIYYHFDYVGGPRNYKWLNTNQISRVWEQMHLAYDHGVNRLWIVNVGDIKPMEFPTEFFLDYAWNPDAWPAERLPEYTRLWADRQFGEKYAKEIATILMKYTQFNSRRKPELLSPDTYSLVNFHEAESVVAEYNKLAEKAKRIGEALPPECKDAYYQLVLHPVAACANLNELYVTVGTNRLYAKQGRAATNDLAEKAKKLFIHDSVISDYYNRVMAGGKWNHMMDQIHIGYTYWQQPDTNVMPKTKMIETPSAAEMGVSIEGSDHWWPAEQSQAVLPEFNPFGVQTYSIDVFNRGKASFAFSAKADQLWVHITPSKGTVDMEQRVWVRVDWKNAPAGRHEIPILIGGPNNSQIVVHAVINNPVPASRGQITGFVESNGCVSIEAEHFSQAKGTSSITWTRIPDLGRTFSAMTPIPVTAASQTPGGENPCLEYRMYLFTKGEVRVKAFLSPTLNFYNNQGLRYAISFDDEPPQIINMHAKKTFQDWEESVRNNITMETSKHVLTEAGGHILKFWMIDPGVVLQKLVVVTGESKSSYLGPPESILIVKKK
ncbi:MAG: glycosyl hydrolase 115 family protein [Ignavibacteriales bacterium]|nr:glycosyl hydrolase 115 family protein [Ignavibacteriales bacterium]